MITWLSFLITVLIVGQPNFNNLLATESTLKNFKIESKSVSEVRVQKITLKDAKRIDQDKIDDLKVLGLVWGYLKYYHPNVAKGNFDWDSELINIIPAILETNTIEQRDDILLKWIYNLGNLNLNLKNCNKIKHIKFRPDLRWIKTANISKALQNKLIQLKDVSRIDSNAYVSLKDNIKNPIFNNEEPYSLPEYPELNYRLLSLFRYWNIIQYYFPYKNLIKENWVSVLQEFIPIFMDTKDKTDYTLAVLKLIGHVHDTHANIWGFNLSLELFKGLKSSPARLRFIEGKAVVIGYYNDSLSKSTELLIGDVITKINGKPVDSIIINQLSITPASNFNTQLRDISINLLRTNDSKIEIEFSRKGDTIKTQEETFVIGLLDMYNQNDHHECFRLINESIAYLYLGTIKNEYLDSLWNVIKDTRGLIIDLRCYPSDFVVFSLGNYLMPNIKKFVKFTNGSVTCPGLFTFTSPLTVGKKNNSYYKGKVILLVDESTQSNAEYTAMALSVAPKVTIIGSTTAGADGNVSRIYLPGGIFTMISGIGVYYPNGKETQRVGIIPDIFITPTLKAIKQGEDELIEKAISLINKN